MQVPAILYGDAKEVRIRCRTALRGWLKSDVPYIQVMEASGMLDVADIPEPINLEFNPRSYPRARGHGLYLAAPAYCLSSGAKGLLLNQGAPYPPHWWTVRRLEEFFHASLTRPWALLSILYTQHARFFFSAADGREPDHIRRFTASILRDCAELEAVGARYLPAVFDPNYLAHLAWRVYWWVETFGATPQPGDLVELLRHGEREGNRTPEPEGGLRGVLAAVGAVIDPAWAAERLPDQPTVLIPKAPPPSPPPCDASAVEAGD